MAKGKKNTMFRMIGTIIILILAGYGGYTLYEKYGDNTTSAKQQVEKIYEKTKNITKAVKKELD